MKLSGASSGGYPGDTTISWPTRRELSRILHRPRPHHAVLYTHRFLNSDPIINFDDETKVIRAEAGSLLKRVCAPLPRPSTNYLSYEGTLSRYPNTKLPNTIINMSYYKDPASYTIGRGHLACMEFAGGRGYPRRPRFYADENRNIRDEIKFRSYYNKHPSPITIPEALPTGFAARIFHLPPRISSHSPYSIYKHTKSFKADEPSEKVVPKKNIKEEKPPAKEIEPIKPKPVIEEENKTTQSDVTFSFKRKSPVPKAVPETVEVEAPKSSEEVKEEATNLNFSIKIPKKSSCSPEKGLKVKSVTDDTSAPEEETTTIIMKQPKQEKDLSRDSSRRSSRTSTVAKVTEEEEEPTVITMKAPGKGSSPSSRRSSGASKASDKLEDEPVTVTMKRPSQEKDSNPPSKSSSRRSSGNHPAKAVEEETITTAKPSRLEDSNPPSKSSSRRSSGTKKLDDNVEQKSPGSKSRSKTPDVIISEPQETSEFQKEINKIAEEFPQDSEVVVENESELGQNKVSEINETISPDQSCAEIVEKENVETNELEDAIEPNKISDEVTINEEMPACEQPPSRPEDETPHPENEEVNVVADEPKVEDSPQPTEIKVEEDKPSE